MSLLFNTLSKFIIAFLPRSKHLLISWLQSPSAVNLSPRKENLSLLPLLPLLFAIHFLSNLSFVPGKLRYPQESTYRSPSPFSPITRVWFQGSSSHHLSSLYLSQDLILEISSSIPSVVLPLFYSPSSLFCYVISPTAITVYLSLFLHHLGKVACTRFSHMGLYDWNGIIY